MGECVCFARSVTHIALLLLHFPSSSASVYLICPISGSNNSGCPACAKMSWKDCTRARTLALDTYTHMCSLALLARAHMHTRARNHTPRPTHPPTHPHLSWSSHARRARRTNCRSRTAGAQAREIASGPWPGRRSRPVSTGIHQLTIAHVAGTCEHRPQAKLLSPTDGRLCSPVSAVSHRIASLAYEDASRYGLLLLTICFDITASVTTSVVRLAPLQ